MHPTSAAHINVFLVPMMRLSPDQALAKLLDGNADFVAGRLTSPATMLERRSATATAPDPFAMVLTCADSRVIPEQIFNCTIGDLFVCRVAGNFLEPAMLGSLEYAVLNFKSTAVLFVLGHQRCAAIAATISGVSAPGSIDTIVAAIRPVVETTQRGEMSPDEYVDAVVRANAVHVARSIVKKSAIVRDAIAAKNLKVVAARYSVDSGEVTLLGNPLTGLAVG